MRQLCVWLPTVILFSFVLLSSLRAIELLPVQAVLVFRNFSPIPTAFCEHFLTGVPHTGQSLLALLGIFVGIVMYGYAGLTSATSWSLQGLGWMVANVAAVVAELLYNKVLLRHTPDHSPFSLSVWKNVLSLPVLLAFAVASAEFPAVADSVGGLTAWRAVPRKSPTPVLAATPCLAWSLAPASHLQPFP